MIKLKYVILSFYIISLFGLCSGIVYAQNTVPPGHKIYYQYIENGDTVLHRNIQEVKVWPPLNFKNEQERIRYSKLVRNIKIVLPYARMAASKINEIEYKLNTIDSKRARERYLKKEEKALFKEFEAPLRKLNFSQGRLLIKLIDRETGSTSYDLIKQLKSGFSAFMWQSVARIFGANLKSEYDAAEEDRYIEYIIYQIDRGRL